MSNKSIQRGSAHLVIVIVLVVALLGALGFIFYQNFVAKHSTDTTTSNSSSTSSKSSTDSTTTSTAVPLVDGSIDSSFGTTLTFKYPSTWKYSQTISGTIDTALDQRITLTSPSGKYVVKYDVDARGGIGGTCVPDETGTIATAAYQVVPGFSGASYLEMTYQNMPTDATNQIGVVELIDSTVASTLKAGDSVCKPYMHEIIKLADENSVYVYGATMTVSDATTASQLKSALSGTEYEQGKAILLSTTH